MVVLDLDIVRRSQRSNAWSLGERLDVEALPVVGILVYVVLVERTVGCGSLEARLLWEEIEDIGVSNIACWGRGTVVIRDRSCGVHQGAIGRESQTGLPEVETCGAVCSQTWRHR